MKMRREQQTGESVTFSGDGLDFLVAEPMLLLHLLQKLELGKKANLSFAFTDIERETLKHLITTRLVEKLKQAEGESPS